MVKRLVIYQLTTRTFSGVQVEGTSAIQELEPGEALSLIAVPMVDWSSHFQSYGAILTSQLKKIQATEGRFIKCRWRV